MLRRLQGRAVATTMRALFVVCILAVARTEAASLAGGVFHSCAIVQGGERAACWGDSSKGQAPAIKSAPSPTNTFTDVSAEAYRTCLLEEAGDIDCQCERPEDINLPEF